MQLSAKTARVLFTILSLVLAVSSWVFGLSLLPSMALAQERGTFVPWLVTWTMIWLTTLSAVALAGFLVRGEPSK